MIHNETFLQAIAEHPDDDSLRLIYADWMEEHGDSEYADFIRVQVLLRQHDAGAGTAPAHELARLSSRERFLLSKNSSRWLQPLRDLGVKGRIHGEFTRGFVDEPVIDAAMFLERGEELFRHTPVVGLYLHKVGRLAKRLSHCPLLQRVRQLHFEGKDTITPTGLHALLQSEHLANLVSLSISNVRLSDSDILDLAETAVLPSLRWLSMSETRMTGATLPALVTRFKRLEDLGLYSNKSFEPENLAAILAAMNPATARKLAVEYTRLETVGMRALAGAKPLTGLEELWLRQCGFNAQSMQALATATHLNRVKKLYLGDDQLTDAGGAALAQWPGLHSLVVLNLDRCGIHSGGGIALMSALRSQSLRELELRGCGIGDDALQALSANEVLGSLHTLDLTDNAITAAGIGHLAASPRSAKLRHLELRENQLGDQGAAIIADSPHLRSLRWLGLDENGVSQEWARRLVVELPNLTIYSTDGGFFHGESLQTLRDALAIGGSQDEVNLAVQTRREQAMLDDPEDMEARELYASCLRDIGSPWWVVIRLQRPVQEAPREVVESWQNSFQAGRTRWLAPLLPWAQLFDDHESFDRGLLRKVHFRPLPDDVAEELARFPPLAFLPLEVQRGHMTGEGAFQVLARRSYLSRLNQLDFQSITARELRHILDSPHVTTLEALSFGHCQLDDEAAQLLAASPKMLNLRTLDFGRGDIVSSEHRNRIGPEGLAALARSPHFSQLQSLGLQGCAIGDAGVAVLLAAPWLNELTSLDLRSTGLTHAGLGKLVESPKVRSLRTLRLGGHEILHEEAVKLLARSPHLKGLYELELDVSDEGAQILCASPNLSNLITLRVKSGLSEAARDLLRKRFENRYVDNRPLANLKSPS